MEEIVSLHNTPGNLTGGNENDTQGNENKKYIDPECYNDDLEEVIN